MGQPNPPADPGATPPAPPANPPADPAPPATGDDLGKMREALSKANEEAKKFRLELKELRERDPVKELLAKLGAQQDPGTDPAKALEARIAAAEQRAADAEAKALRADVAQAKGLTAAQARRLQGSTREELEADADDLLASFPAQANGTPGTPRPDPTQGARGSGAPGKLSVDDVRKLSAEGKYAEIEKARVEGRIDYESARKR